MKSIIGFILLFISAAAFAQTEKGSVMIGGTLGFSSMTYLSTSTTSLNLSPSVSYFFFDRFAAGIVTPYSSAKATSNGTPFGSSWNYSIGPTVRYYFLKGPLGFFPEVSYSWGWSHTQFDPTASSIIATADGSSTLLKAGGGVTYFLNKNVGVEGVLSYQETHRKTEYTSPPNGPTIISGGDSGTTGLNLQVGLQVYLVTRKP